MPRTYHVPDVSCSHCEATITTQLAQVDGVTAVTVDLEQRAVTVDGEVDDATIAAALDEAGYTVAEA